MIYPEEYDPMVAEGPCTDQHILDGTSWTPEDTIRMRELEKQVTYSDIRPVKRWYIDMKPTFALE
jgi:hypothetical protein